MFGGVPSANEATITRAQTLQATNTNAKNTSDSPKQSMTNAKRTCNGPEQTAAMVKDNQSTTAPRVPKTKEKCRGHQPLSTKEETNWVPESPSWRSKKYAFIGKTTECDPQTGLHQICCRLPPSKG